MDKKLIIINGPMGVGKSAAAEALHRRLEGSVRLDGDWCWQMNPLVVNEENRQMVEDNIVFLLDRFLGNSSSRFVIFSWVMQYENMFARLLDRLEHRNFRLYKITLLCSPEALEARNARDVTQGRRDAGAMRRAADYLPLYADMDTIKLDASGLSPEEAAEKIREIIKE
jgi:chloramphenicol 3-O-phosphotransferase